MLIRSCRQTIPFLILLVCQTSLFADDKSNDDKKFKISKTEQSIIDYVNASRKAKKLPPLKPNPTLMKVARGHSANMAKQQKMKHVLDGKRSHDRVKASGYRYSFTGENIAAGDPRWPVKAVHKMWMDSPPHRQNILRSQFTEIGVGVGKSKEGEMFYTQVFARPKKRRP